MHGSRSRTPFGGDGLRLPGLGPGAGEDWPPLSELEPLTGCGAPREDQAGEPQRRLRFVGLLALLAVAGSGLLLSVAYRGDRLQPGPGRGALGSTESLSQQVHGQEAAFHFRITQQELERSGVTPSRYVEERTRAAAEAVGYLMADDLRRSFMSLTDAKGLTYAGPEALPAQLQKDTFPLEVEYSPRPEQQEPAMILPSMLEAQRQAARPASSALSAAHLRTAAVSLVGETTPPPASCALYGCGAAFDATRSCQCNFECQSFSDCCRDFHQECEVPEPGVCSAVHANCSDTWCCNDPGALCFQRDASWATCARSCKAGLHAGDTEWTCKVLGQPLLASLFCFAAMMTGGEEERLVRSQFRKREGIFSCDGHQVFSDREVELSPGALTVPLPSLLSPARMAGALTASWVNREPFMEAWDQVAARVLVLDFDWVVKVDPDTVFFPSQLRLHLRTIHPELKHDLHRGVYLRNCLALGGTDPLQFFGSAEVLSQAALLQYLGRGAACDFTDNPRMGEDMWMQRCLDALNVTAFSDGELLSDAYCPAYRWQPAPCVFGRAAYHPLKSVAQWWACWEQVMAADLTVGLTL